MKVLIVVVLIVLLLCVPVGADVGYAGDQLTLKVRVGPLTVTLFPKKPGKDKPKKKPKKDTAQEAESQPKEKQKRKLDVTKEEIWSAVQVVFRSVKKLRFRLNRIKIHFISAFPDPYHTAMVYGYTNAAVDALGLTMRKGTDIQLGADFSKDKPVIDVYCSVTIRILYIMKLVFSVLLGAVPILMQRHRRLKLTKKANAQAAGKEV